VRVRACLVNPNPNPKPNPIPKPNQAPGLEACGAYLRRCGAAAWGDARCRTQALWPPLLGQAAGREASRRHNGTSAEACAHALLRVRLRVRVRVRERVS